MTISTLLVFLVSPIRCDTPIDCQIVSNPGKPLHCIFKNVDGGTSDTFKISFKTDMGRSAYTDGRNTKYIRFLDSFFKTIPSTIFTSFGNIESIKYKNGKLKSLNNKSFEGHATHLKRIEFHGTEIKEITSKAFHGAENLEEIILENCVIKDIANDAFEGLTKLKKVSLKGSTHSFMSGMSNTIILH